MSPVDNEQGYCLDVASCMYNDLFSRSLSKDDDIDFACPIALKARYIASRIDTHGNEKAVSSSAAPILFVQYNVQTLKDESYEIDLHSRFKIDKCAIRCLQENRKRYSGIKDMHGYFRCIAGAEHGDHGVEVVFSRTCPLAISEDGQRIFVEMENLSILVSNPRCIIVRVCNKHVDFYVVSAHAPYLQSTTDHKSWWEDFTNKIKQHCRFGKPVVIGIDVNSQIYESNSFC